MILTRAYCSDEVFLEEYGDLVWIVLCPHVLVCRCLATPKTFGLFALHIDGFLHTRFKPPRSNGGLAPASAAVAETRFTAFARHTRIHHRTVAVLLFSDLLERIRGSERLSWSQVQQGNQGE